MGINGVFLVEIIMIYLYNLKKFFVSFISWCKNNFSFLPKFKTRDFNRQALQAAIG